MNASFERGAGSAIGITLRRTSVRPLTFDFKEKPIRKHTRRKITRQVMLAMFAAVMPLLVSLMSDAKRFCVVVVGRFAA